MLSKNAESILRARYLKKDENGIVVETPKELFERVANNVANGKEEKAKKYFDIMWNLDFIPNSPTLMNAGRKLQQLSACFVLPVEDSIESIFKTIKDTAMIHKSGGGTGFSFDKIRAKNSLVSTSHGKASGPISFMKVFNEATEAINQGGFRRGANMGILSVNHPDILEFIDAKKDLKELNNFNISVGITKKFMEDYYAGEEQNIIIFNKIVENAWESGEPGIVFLDNIKNPTPFIGKIEATNPCGEQPLLPYEACNLGSINISNFIKNNVIEYDRLRQVICTAVEFLDDVINVSKFPIQEITNMVQANRKIGLGIMGWADLLYKLNIRYDEEDAIDLAKYVMSFINDEAKKHSRELGRKFGSYPNFRTNIINRTYSSMRNATRTTIAPTGTISIIADCSSGIEPVFALVYKRKVMDSETLYVVNPVFEKALKDNNIYSEELLDKVAENGSIQNIDSIPETIKKVFVTAHDIKPETHVLMQATFQQYTDNAVSKTVNFPKSATKEDIKKVYELAYNLNCVGVTVYRDGSRDNQVLSTKETTKKEDVGIVLSSNSSIVDTVEKPLKKKPRPKKLNGSTYKIEAGCGKLYVTINEDKQGKPFELFAEIGKAGGCAASQTQAIGRLVSLSLRAGINPNAIVKQLIGIGCHTHTGLGNCKVTSCADGIAKAIQAHLENKEELDFEEVDLNITKSMGACPDCGGQIVHEGGCDICKICGYSKCS